MHGLDGWLEKGLRDQRGNKRAQAYNRDQDCVLPLINNFVLQAKKG